MPPFGQVRQLSKSGNVALLEDFNNSADNLPDRVGSEYTHLPYNKCMVCGKKLTWPGVTREPQGTRCQTRVEQFDCTIVAIRIACHLT